MRYFQCSKCKSLVETSDTPALPEVVCDSRRMRELTKDQYDHETIQRDYVDGEGPAPSGTVLMELYNA